MASSKLTQVLNFHVLFDCPTFACGHRARVHRPILKNPTACTSVPGRNVELWEAAARLIPLFVQQKNDPMSSTFLPIRVAVPRELVDPSLDRR
jgi:hypothetical protein